MTERILVTGATGALGPCVVECLLIAGFQVRALVRSLPPSGLLPDGVECWIGDITKPETLPTALKDCSKVVHLAALLHIVNPSPTQAADYERINVQGTRNLLQAALAQSVERLILVSTIAVYGSQAGKVLCETSPTHPDSDYGKSKLAAEQIVLQARRRDGGGLGVVLRLGAVYGKRVKGNYQRLLTSLHKGRFLPIGKGDNRRSLIYEKDVAEAILLVLQQERALGQLYNLTDGVSPSVNEIVKAICGALGRSAPHFSLPLAPLYLLAGIAESVARLVGRQAPINRAMLDKYTEEVIVNSQKIQQELGFVARYNLQKGWQEVVEQLLLKKMDKIA